MILNPKWLFGFITGTTLLMWGIVFWFVLGHYLSMGPGLYLFFGTVGIFVLLAVLMVLFVFFRQTRPISFGLAIPLLVLQIGMLIETFRGWDWGGFVDLVGCAALLIVAIAFLTR